MHIVTKRIFHIILIQIIIIACLFGVIRYVGLRDSIFIDITSMDEDTTHSASGNYLAARFSMHKTDASISAQRINAAIEESDNSPAVVRQGYEFMLFLGRNDEALKLAKTYAHASEKYGLSQLLIALDHINNGRYLDAKNLLEAMHNEPQKFLTEDARLSDLIVPASLVWSYVGQKQYDNAIKIIDASAFRELPMFRFQKAMIERLKGNHEAATKLYPEFKDARNYSYAFFRELVQFFHQNNRQDVVQALIGDYQKFHPDYTGSLEEKQLLIDVPQEVRIREQLATVLIETAIFMQANSLLSPAIYYFRLALFVDPTSNYARIFLANALENEKSFDAANKLYAEIPENSTLKWKSRLAMAANLSRLKKNDDAVAMLEKMDKERPKQAEVQVNLGDLYLSNKNFMMAEAAYSKAISRIATPSSEHWGMFHARGVTRERMGQWEKAEVDFKKALELKPDHPETLNYLGYSWLIRGEHVKEALHMLEKAVMAAPTEAHIIDSYGWALYTIGEFDQALRLIEQAALMRPGDVEVNDHLGDVYWRVGRKIEAEYVWNYVLKLDPEPEVRKNIKKKLVEGLPEFKKPSFSVDLTPIPIPIEPAKTP